MKKLQYFISYNFRLLERYKKYLFLFGFVVLLIGFFVIRWQQDKTLVTISEGIVGTYTNQDLPPQITSLLSQPLVKLDETGQPQPGIFKSWQVDKDAKVYDFQLADNLKWQDGSPIVASDITIPVGETEVSVKDPKTVEVKLADSFSPLPSLLNKPAFKNSTNIGTGPYYIDKMDTGQVFISRVILKSHDKNLPEVDIRFYANEETAKQALQIGEVSSLVGVNSTDPFDSQSPFKVFAKTDYSKIVSVFYNTKDHLLADKNLRLVFSFAAPSIAGQTEAKTSISPASWAFNSDVKDYLDNADQAKTYMDKVKIDKGTEFTLTSTQPLEDVGKELVQKWNAFGLPVKLKVESGVPQNFQMLLVTQNIPTDPDQYSLWHSTQSETNVAQFSSPRVDKDLEDGRKDTDQAVRLVAYKDFQKVLLDESPATFLYFPKFNVVYLKKVENDLLPVLKMQFPSLHI